MEVNRGMREFVNSEEFSDVSFIFPDVVLHGHRVILSSFSDFFKDVFMVQFKGVDHVQLTFPDYVSSVSFYSVLQFIYTGDPQLRIDTVVGVYIAALELQASPLEDVCVQFVATELGPDQLYNVLRTVSGNDILSGLFSRAMQRRIDLVIERDSSGGGEDHSGHSGHSGHSDHSDHSDHVGSASHGSPSHMETQMSIPPTTVGPSIPHAPSPVFPGDECPTVEYRFRPDPITMTMDREGEAGVLESPVMPDFSFYATTSDDLQRGGTDIRRRSSVSPDDVQCHLNIFEKMHDHLSTVFLRVLSSLSKMFSADRSSLFVYDEKNGEMFTKYGFGGSEVRVPVNASAVGRCFQSARVENVTEVTAIPAQSHMDSGIHFDAEMEKEYDGDGEYGIEVTGTGTGTGYSDRAVLCCPLVSNRTHRVIGVIEVVGKAPGLFTENDERSLMTITRMMSCVVEDVLKDREDLSTGKIYLLPPKDELGMDEYGADLMPPEVEDVFHGADLAGKMEHVLHFRRHQVSTIFIHSKFVLRRQQIYFPCGQILTIFEHILHNTRHHPSDCH
eukprot:TRINITY_DN39437_c0_g1_i2.p1 TRINITY_DN39437_c0_g1~~TRINITY_DN39437_c0_g1_i2.p1  ORF type:complete len:569 (+),score=140.21 TRINITY_DN39437_c0_g1_i2:34-1707(+)